MILLLFLFGLFIGSFLGVVVDRFKTKKSFIKGRSKCDFCNHNLGIFDLVPVFSFLIQKGKCRYCKHSLPLFYPMIEVVTGLVFATVYLVSIFNFQFLIFNEFLNLNSLILNPLLLILNLFIASLLIVVFFIDLKYGIIPDKITLLAILFTLVFLIINHQSSIINHLASALGAFLFFMLISFVFYKLTKKSGMGGGDIKFAFFMGLVLGFPNIIVALYIAFLTGAAYSIILVIWKKKSVQKGKIAFGPFLALSTYITMLWGNVILENALKLLGI